MSLSYSKVILWKTHLANVVLDYIDKINGFCISFGLHNGSTVYFHIYNLEFAEDSKDVKGATHVTNLVAFHRNLE